MNHGYRLRLSSFLPKSDTRSTLSRMYEEILLEFWYYQDYVSSITLTEDGDRILRDDISKVMARSL
ncbi:hypothetical protein PsorP6_002667 [Peronosclerospora sorghi]|uniref:Uncharacterized protein n=1 Tax=Peronosclerospora sorghi TaxID=230839 RepID=A0ACC0WU51_9STRA|nr:hypothetical protein PsorP6_002667 [Peronosclerospora sorghi]